MQTMAQATADQTCPNPASHADKDAPSIVSSGAASDKPTAASAKATPEQRPRSPMSRVACTHTVMDRVFSLSKADRCEVCGRVPSTGFTYVCQQDSVNDVLSRVSHPPPASKSLPMSKAHRKRLQKSLPVGHKRDSSVIKELEHLGFNKSIIKAAEEGHYTSEQIAILKAQKLHVKATIQNAVEEKERLRSVRSRGSHAPFTTYNKFDEEEKESTRSKIPSEFSDKIKAAQTDLFRSNNRKRRETEDRPDALLARNPQSPNRSRSPRPDSTEAATPSSSDKSSKPKGNKTDSTPPNAKAFQACDFRVCHKCRPLFRDRCFGSFDLAFSPEVQPVDEWIPQLMPVRNVEVMKTIGLKEWKPTGAPPVNPFAASHPCIAEYEAIAPPKLFMINSSKSASATNGTSESKEKKHLSVIGDSSSLHQIEIADAFAPSPHAIPTRPSSKAQHESRSRARDPHESSDLLPPTIKPQASSLGFKSSLAKDMRDIIERARRESITTTIPHAIMSRPPPPGRDKVTGLDNETLERLCHLYRTSKKEIFDLTLWRALSDAVRMYASHIPLPGKDGEDGLDEDIPTMDDGGMILGNLELSHRGDFIGVALTEEAAELRSPDLITSV